MERLDKGAKSDSLWRDMKAVCANIGWDFIWEATPLHSMSVAMVRMGIFKDELMYSSNSHVFCYASIIYFYLLKRKYKFAIHMGTVLARVRTLPYPS